MTKKILLTIFIFSFSLVGCSNKQSATNQQINKTVENNNQKKCDLPKIIGDYEYLGTQPSRSIPNSTTVYYEYKGTNKKAWSPVMIEFINFNTQIEAENFYSSAKKSTDGAKAALVPLKPGEAGTEKFLGECTINKINGICMTQDWLYYEFMWPEGNTVKYMVSIYYEDFIPLSEMFIDNFKSCKIK